MTYTLLYLTMIQYYSILSYYCKAPQILIHFLAVFYLFLSQADDPGKHQCRLPILSSCVSYKKNFLLFSSVKIGVILTSCFNENKRRLG